MPTFPSYSGPPLPKVLNPLNPRHYLMLADWIYFKPSRFKQYLYRADPDLYRQSGRRALAAALRQPAYRSLPAMALVLTLALSSSATWGASAAQATDVQWGRWALGLALGLAFGAAMGVLAGAAAGLALGITAGLALGITAGTAMGVGLGVTAETMAFTVAYGVALGMAVGVGFGEAVSAAFGVTYGVVAGAAAAVTIGVVTGAAEGAVIGVATVIGALRGVFYVFQILPALWQVFRSGSPSCRLARHPALWDELAVLPLPGMGKLLAGALAEDAASGLTAARHLLRNPFQRWAVGRGLAHFLAGTPDPLAAVYDALPDPLLDESFVEPLVEWQYRDLPQARALWLGEMGGIFVDATAGRSRTSERLAWAATHRLRGHPHPQVAPLARFLLHLLQDGEKIAAEGVQWALLEEAVDAVQALAHGEEIAHSLSALVAMAAPDDLASVAGSGISLAWMHGYSEDPIRPQVLEALRGLGDVSAEVARFLQATSPATQAAALNRAIGLLNELAAYVEEINLPERTLLRLAVERWQSLVAQEAGRLGERALREMAPAERQALAGGERQATFWSRPAEPFPNPYKTGDPVAPPLFVGRQDIFSRIQGVWSSGKTTPDSVILYGHRRMGKSSILRNLKAYAPPGSLLIYADLKGETAFAEGTQHLLRGLAEAVAWAAQGEGLDVQEPPAGDYTTPAKAAPAFRRLLHRALATIPETASLILALDEFEAVDAAVAAGKIGHEIYDYLRALSQEPRIVLVFAGLHQLDEMSRDYSEAFFDSYVNVRVSYLPPQAAERLIERPTLEFTLNYHPAVVERIICETHGQPLLVQRICQELVHHVNYELFDLELEREARILPEDLDAVLNDAFVRSETRYFDGVWSDQIAGRTGVEATLETLARVGPAQAEEIASETERPISEISDALAYLKTRDLADANEAGEWDLLVPLMRRWLQLR
jgi:hypothetical protein